MSTIVNEQAEVRLTVEQLIAALRQLSPQERDQVQCELQLPLWEDRLDNLLGTVATNMRPAGGISDEDITAETKSVCATRYHNGRR